MKEYRKQRFLGAGSLIILIIFSLIMYFVINESIRQSNEKLEKIYGPNGRQPTIRSPDWKTLASIIGGTWLIFAVIHNLLNRDALNVGLKIGNSEVGLVKDGKTKPISFSSISEFGIFWLGNGGMFGEGIYIIADGKEDRLFSPDTKRIYRDLTKALYKEGIKLKTSFREWMSFDDKYNKTIVMHEDKVKQ
jgi:hypothetical protein